MRVEVLSSPPIIFSNIMWDGGNSSDGSSVLSWLFEVMNCSQLQPGSTGTEPAAVCNGSSGEHTEDEGKEETFPREKLFNTCVLQCALYFCPECQGLAIPIK